MKYRLILRTAAAMIALAGIFSCAPQNGLPAPAAGYRSGDSAVERKSIDAILQKPAERPGLATGWGDEKTSTIVQSSFMRATSKPAGTDAIYYNNLQGIQAMAKSPEKVNGMQRAAGSLVEWGVKGRFGFLPTYKEYGYNRRLVVGENNSNYTIVVHNRSKSALEIVASVDGLDVNDGKPASYSKPGYIVEPGSTLEIDGFRTSTSTVAAFKFSSVANSYANLRHGDTRNVGVIGIAVFTQKGVNPWTWMPREIKQRDKARAFAEAP